MQTTVRVHGYSAPAFVHVTDDKQRAKETHVDKSLGDNESWYYSTPEEKYEELFGDAIAEYNVGKKQCRQIHGVKGYMENVIADTRGRQATKRKADGKKVPDLDIKKGKKLYYELTVSVGNTTAREHTEDGRTKYTKDGHLIMTQRVPDHINRAICRKYFETFEQRNPHMKIMTANYHADEFFENALGVREKSIEHLTILYVPYADGGKTGMRVQTSMNKALKQQGFSSYDDWQKSEREYMESIAQDIYHDMMTEMDPFARWSYWDYGDALEILHPYSDRRRQSGRLSSSEFREVQDAEEKLRDLSADIKDATEHLDDLQRRIAQERASMNAEIEAQEEKEKQLDAKEKQLEDALKKAEEAKEKFRLAMDKVHEKFPTVRMVPTEFNEGVKTLDRAKALSDLHDAVGLDDVDFSDISDEY